MLIVQYTDLGEIAGVNPVIILLTDYVYSEMLNVDTIINTIVLLNVITNVLLFFRL